MARQVASRLAATGISPNAISVASIVFALAAFACLLGTQWAGTSGSRALFLASALLIQCRLLANLFDGMVAMETGQSSKLGELFNEIPDRIADALVLIGAGYALGGSPILGYTAALLAIVVAYLRAIGNLVGAKGLFLGPMAKAHRMAVVTAGAVYCAISPAGWPLALASSDGAGMMTVLLIVISVGCLATSVRRIASTIRQIA